MKEFFSCRCDMGKHAQISAKEEGEDAVIIDQN